MRHATVLPTTIPQLSELHKTWQFFPRLKKQSIKSCRFAVSFREISRLCSAFIFFRWSKLAYIYIQVPIISTKAKVWIYQQKILIRNRFQVQYVSSVLKSYYHRRNLRFYLNKIVVLKMRIITWN